MNKTKIDWCDYSWNPVTGCNGGCSYCYARKIYHRFKRSFKPTFHPGRLNEIDKMKNTSIIFLGSVTDLWDKEVKPEWRTKIWQRVILNRYHQFIILTKQPQNISVNDCDKYLVNKKMPDNFWVGVSIDNIHDMTRWVALSQKEYIKNKIISFEPVLNFNQIFTPVNSLERIFRVYGMPKWFIVGALTKSDKVSMALSRIEAMFLIKRLKKLPNCPPIFVKDNVGMENPPRKFPKGLIIK